MADDPQAYLAQLEREHREQAALAARSQKVRAHGVPRATVHPRGGYDGGRVTRLNQHWLPPAQSADGAIAATGEVLLRRARDLVRNVDVANAAIDRIIENIIGPMGIDLDSEVVREAASADGVQEFEDAFNLEADELWRQYCESGEATADGLTFVDLEELILREVIEAGQCFVIESADDDPARIAPIYWQLAGPEQLDGSKDQGRGRQQNEIRNGIEFDAKDRPVAYWLFTSDPHDSHAPLSEASQRYPASRVQHIYRKKRHGQSHGVTWFAPVVRSIKDLDFLLDNMLKTEQVRSLFAAVIKSDAVAGPGGIGLQPEAGQETTDEDGNQFTDLAPGIVARLRPGDSVDTVQSGQAAGAAEPWINLLLQLIGMGLGLSRLALTKDFRGISYSGARGNELADRRGYRRLQTWFSPYLTYMRRRWTQQVIGLGKLRSVRPRDLLEQPSKWLRISARPPGWDWVDPTKEVATDREAIAAGLDCHKNRMAMRGLDLLDTWRQLAKEKRLQAKLGLKLSTDPAAPPPAQPPAAPPAAPPPDDDDDEEQA